MTAENKYLRVIHPAGGIADDSIVVDIYQVIDAYKVTCPARQHAIKKLLCAGLRDKGTQLQDLQEAQQAVERAIQMQQRREIGSTS